MKRDASIVMLKHQPGQAYLVANGCPHERPDAAPFYACMATVEFTDRGLKGLARLAKCEFMESSEEIKQDRFEVECTHRGGPSERSAEIGLFGTAKIEHVTTGGDSDGGEPD